MIGIFDCGGKYLEKVRNIELSRKTRERGFKISNELTKYLSPFVCLFSEISRPAVAIFG